MTTSVAVSVKHGRGVGEAGPIGVAVDRSHAGLVPSAVPPRDVDGVAHTAVSQPARVALVQTGLPGQVQLAHGGQLGSQRMAMGGGRG